MGGAPAPPGTAGTTDSRARGAKLPKVMEMKFEHYNIYRDGAVYSVLELANGRKYEGKGVTFRPGCSDLGEQAVMSLVRAVVGGMMREREYLFEKAREEGVFVNPLKENWLTFLRFELKQAGAKHIWDDFRRCLVYMVRYLGQLSPKPESSHYENWSSKVLFLYTLCLADAEYQGFTIPNPIEQPKQLELF